MGVIGKKNKDISEEKKWTEADIQKTLRYHAFSVNGVKWRMENLYVFHWESDMLFCTKSGIYYEYEVKVTRSDFKADKKKKNKHLILEGKPAYNERGIQLDGIRPNYFYYAVPEGLIREEEVPEYAGLVYIMDRWPYVKEVKHAPKLHGDKLTDEQLNLTSKFYYNYINWMEMKEYEMEKLRKEINEAKTVDGKKFKYTLPEAIERINTLEGRIQSLEHELKDCRECIRENMHDIHELYAYKKLYGELPRNK